MSSGKMSCGKATGLLLLMTLLAPAAAFAQTSMGGVRGTVTDPTGAVVSGATVTLVNVRPGRYVLTVELSGFSKAQLTPFTVDVNVTPRDLGTSTPSV